jgi:zinc/manganese transport system substrate-binding protein
VARVIRSDKLVASLKARQRLARHVLVAMLTLCFLFAPVVGCSGKSSTVSGGVIQVVAAESFWGSIAMQLGGIHAHVTTIVTDPNADPHEYETSTADARDFTLANYVILNGAGYDTWGQKLLAANPVGGRKVFMAAELLGKKEGDNPHFWYSPDYVEQVTGQIVKDYQALDPQDAQYFDQQKATFEGSLKQYRDLIASIKQTYTGVKVGSTESIFVYLASALGLDLISPPAFMNAVSQGNDPPTPAVAQFQQQINQKQIALLVYNVQTATLVTTNIKQMAASAGIPTVGVSETIVPPGASFQDWQYAELVAMRDALASGH